MTRRILAAMVCAVTLGLGSVVAAQSTDIMGHVAYVDAQARVIHLADGRIVHVPLGAVIWVDGRPLHLEQIVPGQAVVVRSGGVVAPPATVVVAPPAPAALATHPPIDAVGVVSSVDSVSGRIVLQDGRVLQMTDRTRIWREGADLTAVRPGDRVRVEAGVPVEYRRLSSAHSPTTVHGRRHLMGTVLRADPGEAVVLLDDGRKVRLTPGTRVTMGTQSVPVTQLRRGDQVVVYYTDPATSGATVVTPGSSVVVTPGSTVVREGVVVGDAASQSDLVGESIVITADEILVIREAQAP